jgi:tetratricopeptide (TPR) repeat protein
MDDSLTQLREGVAAMRALVHGGSARFGAPQVVADLQRLMHGARARADAQAELREILILMGVVECQRGELAKARDLLRAGLDIAAAEPADQNQLARDHYFLAGVAGDMRDFQTAAEHFGKSAELARTAPGFETTQRLGIREKHAFALHEAKRFAEAYAVNYALLEDAERHFGADDHRLGTVLINAAQNLYALGRLPEAERLLQRCLGVARAREDVEREQDLLYQLAVLAGEQGRPAAARAHLIERIKNLEKAGTAERLEAARRGLEHFDRHQTKAPLRD